MVRTSVSMSCVNSPLSFVRRGRTGYSAPSGLTRCEETFCLGVNPDPRTITWPGVAIRVVDRLTFGVSAEDAVNRTGTEHKKHIKDTKSTKEVVVTPDSLCFLCSDLCFLCSFPAWLCK